MLYSLLRHLIRAVISGVLKRFSMQDSVYLYVRWFGLVINYRFLIRYGRCLWLLQLGCAYDARTVRGRRAFPPQRLCSRLTALWRYVNFVLLLLLWWIYINGFVQCTSGCGGVSYQYMDNPSLQDTNPVIPSTSPSPPFNMFFTKYNEVGRYN